MDKEFWKGFTRFLDQATIPELQKRLADIEFTLPDITNRDLCDDVRRCMRLLDEELVIRSALAQRQHRN